jgi:hypothetical protein
MGEQLRNSYAYLAPDIAVQSDLYTNDAMAPLSEGELSGSWHRD